MRSTTCRSCGNLEAVVLVGLAPPKKLKQALQRVSCQENRAPKFVLRDMHSFMLAQRGLFLRTTRDDDVAESDRRERQAGYCLAQQATARRKADFQHTANALDFCPSQARNTGCADT